MNRKILQLAIPSIVRAFVGPGGCGDRRASGIGVVHWGDRRGRDAV